MKKIIITLIVVMASGTLFASGIPVEKMSSTTIGIEYNGIITGQSITEAEVPSTIGANYCMFRYAPVPYMLFSLGIGGTVFSTDEYKSTRFRGNPGVSMAVGMDLFSPVLIEMLRITGGVQSYFVNSEKSDYGYTAALAKPSLGLRATVGNFVTLEAGGKGQLLLGSMDSPGEEEGMEFSNVAIPRGYFSVTLHSAEGGAYASFGYDMSRHIAKKSHGINEASFSLEVGFLFSQKRFEKPSEEERKKNDYFKEYDEMKQQQENMRKATSDK